MTDLLTACASAIYDLFGKRYGGTLVVPFADLLPRERLFWIEKAAAVIAVCRPLILAEAKAVCDNAAEIARKDVAKWMGYGVREAAITAGNLVSSAEYISEQIEALIAKESGDANG